MRTAAEILAANGIDLESTAPGRHLSTCPQCSHKRKPAHQKNKCLGLTIDDVGVKFGCNHCGWKSGCLLQLTQGQQRRQKDRRLALYRGVHLQTG